MSKWEHRPPDNPKFLATQFVVRANHNELHQLWARYEKRSTWKQDGVGFWEQVGDIKVDGETFPVCLSGFWHHINGVFVLFYDSCSLVTHHGWCEEWVMEACGNPTHDGTRPSHVNAMNFHNCMNEVERISGVKLKTWIDCRCYE